MLADFELYSWNRGNALAPVLFLEETKTSYHLIPSNPESRSVTKELKKINPLGDIPVLVDRRKGKNSTSVFGTSAILCYLAFDAKKLLPNAPSLYAASLQWLFWQERVIQGNTTVYGETSDDKLKVKCRTLLKKAFKKIDSRLKQSNYIAEEFSIADISLFFSIRKPEDYGIWINEYPNIRNWMTRINARNATKKSLTITFY